MFCPIFAPLQPFSIYVCVCVPLYIGKTPKSVLFAVCSRLPFLVRLQPSFSVFVFTRFLFHEICVCETLCKFMHNYAKQKCMFMQSIMVNRKPFGNFKFSAHLQKRSIFLLFVSLPFILFWIIYRKRKQTQKKPYFCRFCPKTSVFVANKTLIFGVLYLYRVIYAPPPPVFGTRRVGQLSSEFFYFLLFYFFVKYSDFSNSAFLPNFEYF